MRVASHPTLPTDPFMPAPAPCPTLQVRTETAELDAGLIFEQDPVQIVDALLPLYMNATLLRSLQEALASELAARMNAMNNASDNAGAWAGRTRLCGLDVGCLATMAAARCRQHRLV